MAIFWLFQSDERIIRLWLLPLYGHGTYRLEKCGVDDALRRLRCQQTEKAQSERRVNGAYRV